MNIRGQQHIVKNDGSSVMGSRSNKGTDIQELHVSQRFVLRQQFMHPIRIGEQ